MTAYVMADASFHACQQELCMLDGDQAVDQYATSAEDYIYCSYSWAFNANGDSYKEGIMVS